MKKGKLSVQTENILPIIKKWLYSQKEIFLRELISNSFDAINKVKKIALSEDIRNPDELDYAIDIRIDQENNQLIIEDNGLGMNADEIDKYIASIAFSGAHDFIKKYEESGDKDKAGIIGNFGLGFYSSFMVADRVEVDSLSYRKGDTATFWSCSGGIDYEAGEGKREKRGTSITLTINEDSKELLDKIKISELVRKFVDFLPIPVRIDGKEANRRDPIWTKSPMELKEEDYNKFYKYLYPMQEDPLFSIHLNVDYPFQLQGVLFFPRLRHELELNKSNVSIYCKQVFVSEEAQELIPQYLTILQGVIDIPDLPLNVSRSYLQNEPRVKKIASHIVKKVADKLKEEKRKNMKKFGNIWADISPFVKYAMMNDDKFFEQAEEALIFQIANVNPENQAEFLSIEDYQAKFNKKTGDKIYYVSDLKNQEGALKMLNEQGISAILLNALIDNHFVQFIETKKSDFKFVRVDSEISEHLVEKDGDGLLVDSEGKSQKDELIALFRKAVNNEKLNVRVEALKDGNIPSMIILSEHMRRYQEMSAMMHQGQGAETFSLPVEHTLILNSKNPIIKNLSQPALITNENNHGNTKNEQKAKQIYYLARLSQGNTSRSDIENLLRTSYDLLSD